MVIDFEPPEHCPPYSKKCRCERLSVDTREKVERESRALYLKSKQAEKKLGGLLNDEWFRSRIVVLDGPIMTLHEHFAGMGGRSTMGHGVGGFALGAACPSGGLCIVTAVTYDLPWFAKLLNHYVVSVMGNHTDEDCVTFKCTLPNTFCCWQLNFGKNESDKLSETCFYNPHVDKNNAKVSSIGTSFGDYEGGGVWVADPKGTTMIKFENDVEGIHRGLVSGQVATQKTRWVTFWAATNVHAIPPFRKNRVGIVAFSSQTALRTSPDERKMLMSMGFPLPEQGDVRFLPRISKLQALKGEELAKLNAEEREERNRQMIEYNGQMALHQRDCDKMSIVLARETEKVNCCRVDGQTTMLEDGSSRLLVQRRVDSSDVVIKRNKSFERSMTAMDAEVVQLTTMLDSLHRRIQGKKKSTLPDAPEQVREMENVLRRRFAEFKATLIDEHIAPESDDELLDDNGSAMNSGVKNTRTQTKAKTVKEKVIKIKDSLPVLPFRKRLHISRSDRKKLEKRRWKHKLKYGSLDTWKCPLMAAVGSTATAATDGTPAPASTSGTEPKNSSAKAKTAAQSTNACKTKNTTSTAASKSKPQLAKKTTQSQHSKANKSDFRSGSTTSVAVTRVVKTQRTAHATFRALSSLTNRPSASTAGAEDFTSFVQRLPRSVLMLNSETMATASVLGHMMGTVAAAEMSHKRVLESVDGVGGPPMKQMRCMMGDMIRQSFLPGEVVLLEPEVIGIDD
eukprot:GEMP01000554.1.p1 GENE.GEMP01000554.1~~GEMP01000554.1.p1  ORF type:complete len:736 (+),score=223.49 GEMP01000554.1:226-2433(+)